MRYLPLILILIISCSKEESELANAAPESRSCEQTHPLVGQSMDLIPLQHGVSGVVTILSDCEIEISNFTFDGGGPQVHVYGGTDGVFSAGINISEQLNGRVYDGETLTLTLPETSSLDTINSFSIWCVKFRENFGSVVFP